jgi:hypothetical protein
MPIRIASRYSTRALLAATGLVLALASCSEVGSPGPHAQVRASESAQFFAAAVAFSVSQSRAPVRVDPRPLNAESQLHSVSDSDLALDDTATIRLRTGVLTATGIRLTDATKDWHCVFASGMRGPPPGERGGNDPIWEEIRAAEPDSLRVRREACRQQGEYVSLAFGPPQFGTDPEHPQRWRIRVMRMMLHGWEIVDLFLEQRTGGGWEVVRIQERVGAFT